MNDLDLLRKYEPIVRHTQGEMFFATSVDGYIHRCSLWARRPGGTTEQLAAPGELDMEALVTHQTAERDAALFLRFVETPLTGLEYQRWRARRPPFKTSGRLARVGLGPRFLDALFTVSLLMRGKVPGGTAAAAQVQYANIRRANPRHTYYGRVIRQDNYFVLQYLFFYAMNDWRSSFYGVNDHEADWEQVLVYLGEGRGGELEPLWLAAAAHDQTGDDLRRRWDDPDLTIVDGTHPVVYVGAGSHAAYVQPGEYITAVDVKFLQPVTRAAESARRFWRDVLHQGDPERFVRGVQGLVKVPFVDYARGDGFAIGPGQAAGWSPAVLDGDVPWVSGYRGLWGLSTEDVFAGEEAPAGPMYTREGAVRRSWSDPVGWVGLSKVPPPAQAVALQREACAAVEQEIRDAEVRACALRQKLPRLDLEMRALRDAPHLRQQFAERAAEIEHGERDLAELTARIDELRGVLAESRRYLHDLEAGAADDPRAHLSHRPHPEPPGAARVGRLAELWAAISTGVLLLAAVGLITIGDSHPIVGVAMLVLTAVVIDSILRGTIIGLLLNATILLALVTAGALVYEFFWQLSLLAIAAIGLVILLDNLRELRGR